jgi:2-amino-4-hydroxy-6-hydroxymethyldihydropteridine diphosphokinase
VTRAFIGLGSNLGDREATIRKAASMLGPHRLSSLAETEPWGFADQPRFVNAVAEIDTGLTPRALLDRLLAIEAELGRTREGPRYGPRTVDLDLLLYGGAELDEPGLRVPHPRLHERLFALEPLLELDPGLVVPGRGPVANLVAKLQSSS